MVKVGWGRGSMVPWVGGRGEGYMGGFEGCIWEEVAEEVDYGKDKGGAVGIVGGNGAEEQGAREENEGRRSGRVLTHCLG